MKNSVSYPQSTQQGKWHQEASSDRASLQVHFHVKPAFT